MKKYDAIIIGGGPAGIFSAYELSDLDKNILMLDKGKASYKRGLSGLEGFGGAGLFSDVKLCMRHDVGTSLDELFYDENIKKYREENEYKESVLNDIYLTIEEKSSFHTKNNILKQKIYSDGIKELFERFIEVKKIFSEFSEIAGLKKDFENLYGNYDESSKEIEKILEEELLIGSDYYPVIHIGTDQGKTIAREFEKYLEDRIDIQYETEVKKIEKKSNFRVKTVENEFSGDIVILAPGKMGNKWSSIQARRLGCETYKTNPWLGVRVECKKNDKSPLSTYSDDPKIKDEGHWPDEKWKIKLHCFAEGGEVISYPWKKHLLVGGRANSSRSNNNTNFDVLYTDLKTKSDCIENEIKDSIKVQKLGDYLENRKTIREGCVKPTLKEFETGNVRESLNKINKNFSKQLPVFLKKIDKLYPGVYKKDTLIYFPVVEGGSEKIKTGKNMETTEMKNFYVIGDGGGNTQGIISAAVSGMIAGKDIKYKLTSNSC